MRRDGRATALALVIVAGCFACAERIADDWKLVGPDQYYSCRDAGSWVSPDPAGGIRIHASLLAALGYGEANPAFGDSQLGNGVMVPHDGGWLVSVAGPDVPKRWAVSHVYWTTGDGRMLEYRAHGRMIAAVDERGLLSFGMCFWHERGLPRSVDIRRSTAPAQGQLDEGELLAGPYRGACFTALAEDADGVLWVVVRRYADTAEERAADDIDEDRHYLARVGDDGALHYEHLFAPFRFPSGGWGSPYGSGLSQLVIDGPHVYVSGPEIPARRLTRGADGWDETLVVPADCRLKRSTYPLPIEPLPEPDQPAQAQPQTKPRDKPKMPPEARRDSPPEAIATTALTVGSAAPALQDVPSTGGAWSRGEKVTALVVYRGHW